MGSVQTDRRFNEIREIPVRRIMITDPSQIPRDLASTPNGTMYCTTPGGTRIVYDRSLLLKLSCSPMTKTPPSNMKFIPGVTNGIAASPPRESPALSKSKSPSKPEAEDPQFEMDI
ncbi:hypothetical protein RvY_08826 [Ramazzottius varieornatus]|uniref:Uncharacterized protein n=1 Tax=Ramazzottius varieornatus TaxID=947166 RepID=A0A1D1V776_RAMVA|nr:hypothetical protein RvY_08826 [Ramazzottius varieornatus]